MQVAEYWNGADAIERQRVADLSYRQMLAKLATSRIGIRTVRGGVTVEHKESEIVGGRTTSNPASGPNLPDQAQQDVLASRSISHGI